MSKCFDSDLHPHFIAGAVVSAIYASWYVTKHPPYPRLGASMVEKLGAGFMWGFFGGTLAYVNPWFMVPVGYVVLAEEMPFSITWKKRKEN